MKYRRFSIKDYIIYGLAGIGLLSMLLHNPGPVLVPFLVFGVIILLYFVPPGGRKRKQSVVHPGGARKKESRKRKTGFRVIQGNKRPEEDEEPPRYH